MTATYEMTSVVVPVLNEEDSLETLVQEIMRIAPSLPTKGIEVIFVDDGSTDNSWTAIDGLSVAFPGDVKGLRLRRNFGKAVALEVGIHEAKGEIVFLMDADLQDNPAEMPKFFAALDQGADLIVGWKVDRKDPWHKTVPSRAFNYFTSSLTSIRLHDFNCGFKCFRAQVFEQISLYGEMHRYIPVLANNMGFVIAEVPVDHRRRAHGKSKYGPERYLRGALDLVTVFFLTRYSLRPAHVFGGLAVVSGLIGAACLTYLIGLKLFTDELIGNRPLLLLGIMMTLMSLQLGAFGLLAELLVRRMPTSGSQGVIKARAGSRKDSAASTC